MQKTKKVTFVLPAEIVADASHGLLLGEFNNWDKDNGFSLKKSKDGSMKTTVQLEAGKSYEYRYLLDGGRWVNDDSASHYTHVYQFGVANCVVSVPDENVFRNTKTEIDPAPLAVREKKSAPGRKKVKEQKETDDLTKVEGIGKKIAELLNAEGILTYADLAKSPVKRLKSLLEVAGPKFSVHQPSSWPKQAKLAAAGKWEELTALQKELKGGK